MKYIMRRRNVERIADTQESYEKLLKLGYVVKKNLENKPDKKVEEKIESVEMPETETKKIPEARAEPDEATKPKKVVKSKKAEEQED